jgi:hypothetical protein
MFFHATLTELASSEPHVLELEGTQAIIAWWLHPASDEERTRIALPFRNGKSALRRPPAVNA